MRRWRASSLSTELKRSGQTKQTYYLFSILSSKGSLWESNVNNSTLSLQPRHMVDNDTAYLDGRYSGGNHSRFSEFQVIHGRSELTPYPWIGGAPGLVFIGSISEIEDI